MSEHQIEALLAEIPADERATFQAFYQERLYAAMQAASRRGGMEVDPDQIEEELVDALIREAEGRDSASGMGMVPTTEGEYALIPPESDPRLAQPAKGSGRSGDAGAMTPQRWAAIGLVLLVPLLWFFWPSGDGDTDTDTQALDTTTTPMTTTLALVTPTALTDFSGGNDVTVAYPASLELARDDGASPDVYRVLASASELGGVWEPDVPEGVAAWLNGSYINHIFCLPTTAKSTIDGLNRGSVITMRPASGAVRTYTVVRVREVGRQEVEVLDQRRAGMTLILCGDGQNERTVVEAAYQPASQTTATLQRGQAATVPDMARLTVQTVQTLAPTTTTPVGFAEVAITVQVENLTGQVWTSQAMADQLVLDGVLAERVTVEHDAIDAHAARRVTYHYLVQETGGQAIWRATALTGETVAVALTIPPAPAGADRRPFITTLDPASVRLEPLGNGHRFTITAVLTATGSDPVTVDLNGVSVWSGGRTVPLDGTSDSLPIVLQPGTPTPLRLVASVPDVAQLEMQIGQQRWRITLP
ncbi:hypothetical protein [Herpetosiphon geysericola]|uniref:Uncharacterized protein n=1 Tax=Herpetosiphon geysericola TaxID=70996 RepID=A0A0P6Y1Q9_9CHLR|nr:hypothetical protein [Herpetosiphon geysericola]KPL83017.1 hypothetical protein SE18_19430 [Herpetosiphon geysericola]